jgi:tetratricopeptide (TPR) repeat protein
MVWELLGGMRPLVADAFWLRMHLAWERREPGDTMAWLRKAVELNPQSLFFLVNGARIAAYDLPGWRWSPGSGPPGAFRHIRHEQVALALGLLAEGAPWHADNPLWWIERANIALHAADDPEKAADFYRRAALLPGAPHYAARVHAELLLRLGRMDEAHGWLCQVHPTLPKDDPRAQAERVLGRIRELEQQLGLPPGRRYPSRRSRRHAMGRLIHLLMGFDSRRSPSKSGRRYFL